jgi:hypothetical protein
LRGIRGRETRLAPRMCGRQTCDRRTTSPGAFKQPRGSASALAKRSVICADFRCAPTSTWPSRALSHDDIKLSGVAFRPGQDCGLLRRRDPTHAGVCCTVQVESSRLHCSGTNVLSKEGTFCFRPALVNNGGSFHMIRFFRACVNFFRYNSRPICRTIASSTLTGSGVDSGRRCVLRRGFLAPLPDARALAQILAKRWASLTPQPASA